MKIRTSHSQLKADRKLTEHEQKLLWLLEEDEVLEKLLIAARRRAGIPDEGYNLDRPIEEYIKAGAFKKTNFDDFTAQTNQLVALWRLPIGWYRTLGSLLLFNVALPPDPAIEIQGNDREVVLTIRESTSVRHIRDFLDRNKAAVDTLLAKLPRVPKTKMKAGKLLEKKRMAEMKRQGMTDFKIMEELSQYLPGEQVYGYAGISKRRNRLKEFIARNLGKDWRGAWVQMVARKRVQKKF